MKLSDRFKAIGWGIKKTRPDLFLCINPSGHTEFQWHKGVWSKRLVTKLVQVKESSVIEEVEVLEAAFNKAKDEPMSEFWAKKVVWKENGDLGQAIIKGQHYHFNPEESGDIRGRGHGGATFYIQFFDGRKAKTSNLWAQGRIDCPKAREILQDNARFVKEVVYNQV